MVVTHNCRTASARRAVRVDQSLGVNLEMGGGRRMDIGRSTRLSDPRALAQQQPADLKRVRGGGVGAHGGEHQGANLQIRSP
jgi:hypothetical protein